MLLAYAFLACEVMMQWLHVVERAANAKALEMKDEESQEKTKSSVLQERVAGNKRAQVH